MGIMGFWRGVAGGGSGGSWDSVTLATGAPGSEVVYESGTLTIPRGDPGSDGEDGRGIQSEAYDPATGILTLVLTDGSVFGTGDLRGAAGADGADGADGVDGADGPAGADGADGAPGSDGQDGVSVSILTFEPTDQAGYDAAVAANAADPLTLVIRHAE